MSSPVEQFYLNNYSKLLLSAAKVSKKMYVAKDIMQQLYINLRHLEADQLTAIVNPKAYIYFSIKTISINMFRGAQMKSMRDVEFQHEREFGSICMDQAYECMDKAYRLELLAEFSNTLPKVQKEVFTAMLKGVSAMCIASNTKRKYNTVKHNKRIVVEKLREFLNNKGEDFNYGI